MDNNNNNYYCDECNSKLKYERQIQVLDKYNGKMLVCNKYYCQECSAEYEINEEEQDTEYKYYILYCQKCNKYFLEDSNSNGVLKELHKPTKAQKEEAINITCKEHLKYK